MVKLKNKNVTIFDVTLITGIEISEMQIDEGIFENRYMDIHLTGSCINLVYDTEEACKEDYEILLNEYKKVIEHKTMLCEKKGWKKYENN